MAEQPNEPQATWTRGGDGKFTRSADTAERDAEAARLRTRGWDYPRIAEHLGFAGRSGAYAAVQRALKLTVEEPAAEVRAMELERLDRLYEAAVGVLERHHVTVSQGRVVQLDGEPLPDDGPVLQAIDRLLKIQERRARLLGLDAAQKMDVSGNVSYTVVGVPDDDL